MIKKISLLVLLAAAMGVLGLGLWMDSIPLRFEENDSGPPALGMNSQALSEEILPFCQDGIWYYFMPGYLEEQTILLPGILGDQLQVDGGSVALVWSWEEGKTYTFTWNGQDYKVEFRATSQLPTLFIRTESGSLEAIHADKNYQETGTLLALDGQGAIQYQGDLKRIKGRGNSTFSDYEKKPYAIKLEEAVSLAGMDKAKDYTLLALAFDGDKIHSKLGLDLASALGENDTQAQWVNLYLNGEWRGLYLIATAVSHLEKFQEEGAVLIEKNMESRYLESGQGFMTLQGNYFSVKRPQEMTEEELEELAGRVQGLEKKILAGKLDPGVIDLESFAVQALTEEISRNSDAYITSSYFYYLPGDTTLYAGPMWDYDGAFGEFTRLGIWWNDPAEILMERSAEEFLQEGRLSWYTYLYRDEAFLTLMKEVYIEALEELRQMAEEDIPAHAAVIAASAACDRIRWPASQGLAHEGKYESWENNVRYLQYFLGQRINSLCLAWDIPWEPIQFRGNGTRHTVAFLRDGEQVATLQIRDGDLLPQEVMADFYPEGYYLIAQYGGLFTLDLPVLEDCTLEIVLDPPAN